MTAPTIDILKDSFFDGNPAAIMRAMIKMHGQVTGFHLRDLERAQRCWELASMALLGEPRLARAASDEHERFKFLIVRLKNDMQHAKAVGVMILEPSDFPPKPIMECAALALEFAQIGSIH